MQMETDVQADFKSTTEWTKFFFSKTACWFFFFPQISKYFYCKNRSHKQTFNGYHWHSGPIQTLCSNSFLLIPFYISGETNHVTSGELNSHWVLTWPLCVEHLSHGTPLYLCLTLWTQSGLGICHLPRSIVHWNDRILAGTCRSHPACFSWIWARHPNGNTLLQHPH